MGRRAQGHIMYMYMCIYICVDIDGSTAPLMGHFLLDQEFSLSKIPWKPIKKRLIKRFLIKVKKYVETMPLTKIIAIRQTSADVHGKKLG